MHRTMHGTIMHGIVACGPCVSSGLLVQPLVPRMLTGGPNINAAAIIHNQ